MSAVVFSETSVATNKTTRRHNTEGHNWHRYRRQNNESQKKKQCWTNFVIYSDSIACQNKVLTQTCQNRKAMLWTIFIVTFYFYMNPISV
jgi:hypothetical protein